MYRLFLVLGLWFLVGALAALFWLGFQVTRTGITLRLVEPQSPVRVEVANPLVLPFPSPLDVRVTTLPLSIPERFTVGVEGPVHAETGLLRCPACAAGTLLPVRWNLLTGAITWRCAACGREFGP